MAGRESVHPGGNPGANLKSISDRCHLILVAFVWQLTKETIELPMGCLQGGLRGLSRMFSTLSEVSASSLFSLQVLEGP